MSPPTPLTRTQVKNTLREGNFKEIAKVSSDQFTHEAIVPPRPKGGFVDEDVFIRVSQKGFYNNFRLSIQGVHCWEPDCVDSEKLGHNPSQWPWSDLPNGQKISNLYIGDYNKDGKVDLLVQFKNGIGWLFSGSDFIQDGIIRRPL